MDAKTLEALNGSIAKWEKIVAGTGFDHGTDNCPLCVEFVDDEGYGNPCGGCPVAEAVEVSGCERTPYIAWLDADGRDGKADTDAKMAAAKRELEFLKSLLPDELK